ncbi:MAG: glycosyltransferase family 4 protein [Magnetospirillum sp.]|nr:glycosyltransferase family 4 protein [Magnetospirillum sp.]
MSAELLGIGWRPSSLTGWGIFAYNLIVELEARGAPLPLILGQPQPDRVLGDAMRAHWLKRCYARSDHAFRGLGGKVPADLPVLVALGNGLDQTPVSDRSFGVVFFENTAFDAAVRDRVHRFRRILCGCSWNTEVLTGLGVENAVTVLQGVDTALFCPGPKRDLFPGRFIVFSGGKVEFRKGQDIVVAAFRAFRSRHPEALLAFSWNNPYRDLVEGIGLGPHGLGAPPPGSGGEPDFAAWLNAAGLPIDSFLDLGAVPNPLMPGVLHEVDLAVFPNRCEGGTNLVAMEALACGVPVALSANTGHKDLIRPGTCYSLTRQMPPRVPPGAAPMFRDWGETAVDELVETMEAAWRDRDEARRRGAAGAAMMQGLSWGAQTTVLLKAIAE